VNDAGQEKTGEEEVTEMVNANVHLEAVFSDGLRAVYCTWKQNR
jgi:urease gamma subunit